MKNQVKILRSIVNPTYHFVNLCLDILAVRMVFVKNSVVRNLVGRFWSIPCQNSSSVPRGM